MLGSWLGLPSPRRKAADFFFFHAEDGIRDVAVTGVQTCALPISPDLSSLQYRPGRLDRGARRHPAAPIRRASLAGRLGYLRRVPARGVRGDRLGDLAAAPDRKSVV